MNRTPPDDSAINARVDSARRDALRVIRRGQKRLRLGLVLVAIGGVSFGGVGAAVALSETYVDADAYVAPDAAAALAQCLEDDGWDARLLSEAESAAIYEPGDAIVVRIRVRDTELGASGRQVDACRIQIQKETGRSSLPASISGTEDEK